MSTRTRRPRTFTLEVLDDRIAPSAMVFAMAANHGPARPTSQVGPVSSNPFHRGPARAGAQQPLQQGDGWPAALDVPSFRADQSRGLPHLGRPGPGLLLLLDPRPR